MPPPDASMRLWSTASSSLPLPRGCRGRAPCSTTPARTSCRSLWPCWRANWSTAGETTTRHSPGCAARWNLMAGFPTMSHGGWMQPARHAYGALLLEQHRVEEAEAVYRADVGLDDTWLGPASTLAMSGVCTVTTSASPCWANMSRRASSKSNSTSPPRADVPISSSCYCRLTPAANH